MNSVPRYSLIIVWAIILAQCAFGQEQVDSELVRQLAKAFSKTASVDYSAALKVHSNIGGNVALVPALTPEKETTLHYTASENRYYYSVVTSWWKKDAPIALESAYNGVVYQEYMPDQSRLAIGHKAPGLDFGFDSSNALFLPFDFIAVQPDNKSRRALHLSSLRDTKTWERISQVLREHKLESPDPKITIVNFPGGTFEGVHPLLTYRVYFRNIDGYPMRWQLMAGEGNIVREYVVDELAESGGLTYPRRARLLEYGIHLKQPDPQPRARVDVVIDSFDVNTKKADDEVFTIDPAKAALIYDEDSGTGIVVPK